MNYIFKIFILSLITILFSCKSKITKQEIFLKKIREIHEPVVENYLLLWENANLIYLECENGNISCSEEGKNKIIKLKAVQDSLNKIALLKLRVLKKDNFGYKDAVMGFIDSNPYNYPFNHWELFFENLCFCDKNKKILSHSNKSEFDTVSINQLNESNPFGVRIIYYNTHWIGIDKKKYLKKFNLVEKIFTADDWYCQTNLPYLSDAIIHGN